MSKKTLALIIFLFLLTCGLLYLALATSPQKTPTLAPTPTPISVNAKTTISLDVAPASESSTLTKYTLAVKIDTADDIVNSVQLELAFDPQALTNVSVSQGDFFAQPNVLLKNINTTDGRISYALVQPFNTSGKSGRGTVAFLYFDVSPLFTGKSTNISFLPKTAIAADKVLESVLKKASGYVLNLSTQSAIPSESGTTSAR